MEFRENEELRLAGEFVQFTNKNIFLTGKAGTGKTTFLHNLKLKTPKRLVVVAPTGVAAINAGGVTIHSFFQLGFAPFIPESFRNADGNGGTEAEQKKFHREKIRLIKCIDLLVIDEISMVRSDVLDAVDEVLRRFRNPSQPFGGVQLLMIGDLHQLSPVVKSAEWGLLREFYSSAYFFDSHALKRSSFITLELKENFRQSDADFIHLLNKIRENEITRETIDALNARYIPGFQPRESEGYITLTTHNNTANEINQAKLKSIRNTPQVFKAKIQGVFPMHDLPTDEELELKTSAQVMFIKNDPEAAKRFYNGKIGKITRFGEEKVYVRCPGENEDIEVERLIWENIKYDVNPETKEITEEVAGTFEQIPLRLAWAITIHKSQGLTFDKVVIDAAAAFAFGQVYVALSRCRTLEGIVLLTQISGSGIKTDYTVKKFDREAREDEPDQEKLNKEKVKFEKTLILELFDMNPIRYRFRHLSRITKENAQSLEKTMILDLRNLTESAEAETFLIADRFQSQLNGYMSNAKPLDENPDLQERIIKGTAWFNAKLSEISTGTLSRISFESDNKAVKKAVDDSLDNLRKALFIKSACLKTAVNGFITLDYLKTRSSAELDYRSPAVQQQKKQPQAPSNIANGALYIALKNWRDAKADELDLPIYQILPQKSLREIASAMPKTKEALKKVDGIGKVKIRLFGAEILEIVRDYTMA